MRYIDADKLIELANNTKDKTIDANDIAVKGIQYENNQ